MYCFLATVSFTFFPCDTKLLQSLHAVFGIFTFHFILFAFVLLCSLDFHILFQISKKKILYETKYSVSYYKTENLHPLNNYSLLPPSPLPLVTTILLSVSMILNTKRTSDESYSICIFATGLLCLV